METNKNIYKLFETTGNIISIGFNCFCNKFLKTKLMFKKETNFFDNIGISMWTINELLTNDFDDFFNPTHYKKIQIRTNENYNFLTNVKYYVRFPHDLETMGENVNDKCFKDFVDKYSRRKTRLYDLLTNSKKLIFLRLEEDDKERIVYQEYEDKLKKTEFENLLIFTQIIRNKFPNLNFVVIFISKTMETNIYDSNNLIVLNKGKYELTNWKKTQDEIQNVLLSNYDYVKSFIDNKLNQ